MMSRVAGVDWDEGNWPKCGKHDVARAEIEEVSRGTPAVHPDPATAEARLRAIGRTARGRHVSVAFLLREREGRTYIRPISARFMHQREIDRYEQG